ncbi:DUF4328 domain-containing protein [Yinghuangia aomiensis]
MVWWWFPKLIAHDVWKASDPQAAERGGATPGRKPLLWVWWVLCLLGSGATIGTLFLYPNQDDITVDDASDLRTADYVSGGTQLLMVLAAVATILVVRKITTFQHAREAAAFAAMGLTSDPAAAWAGTAQVPAPAGAPAVETPAEAGPVAGATAQTAPPMPTAAPTVTAEAADAAAESAAEAGAGAAALSLTKDDTAADPGDSTPEAAAATTVLPAAGLDAETVEDAAPAAAAVPSTDAKETGAEEAVAPAAATTVLPATPAEEPAPFAAPAKADIGTYAEEAAAAGVAAETTVLPAAPVDAAPAADAPADAATTVVPAAEATPAEDTADEAPAAAPTTVLPAVDTASANGTSTAPAADSANGTAPGRPADAGTEAPSEGRRSRPHAAEPPQVPWDRARLPMTAAGLRVSRTQAPSGSAARVVPLEVMEVEHGARSAGGNRRGGSGRLAVPMRLGRWKHVPPGARITAARGLALHLAWDAADS